MVSASNGDLDLSFTADPRLASESWILQVGSRSYRLDAKDVYILADHTYTWNSPGFSWTDANVGDKVSVSLRTPGVDLTFAPTAVDVDEGDTADYTVKLAAQPSGSVTVDIATDDSDAATVNPARLTFNTVNWNTARTVTVSGVGDADADDETVTLTHSGAGVTTATVEVSVDDDEIGLVFSSTDVTVDEGDTADYTVALAEQPDASVTVAIASGDTTAATVRPTSLTFTTVNWARAQTVTVTGVEDDSDDSDERLSLTHTASGVPARAAPGFTGVMRLRLPATERWRAAEQAVRVASDTECTAVAKNALGSLALEGLTLAPAFDPATRSYAAAAPAASAQSTVTAEAAWESASVAIAPADADPETDGHQVALAVGETEVTVTVTPDGAGAAKTWTVTVTREAEPLQARMSGAVPERAAEAGDGSGGCAVEVSVAFEDADGTAVAVEALAASDFTAESGRVGTPVAAADGLRWTVPVRATTNERGFVRVRLPATERWRADEQVFHNRGAGVCEPAARWELADLRVYDLGISPVFNSTTTSYTSKTADADATVDAEAVYAGATVTIAPADADEENDGHQVALPVGESAIEVTVTPGDGSAAQTYTVAVTREAAVSGSGVLTGFVLVDALTDADLGAVADGATVTVSSAGLYGVRAETQTDAEVGSVALMLRGPGAHGAEHRQMESIAPYSLYGDAQGAEHGRALAAGSYTLTATAHAGGHGVGKTLGTLTVSFTVAVEAAASSAGVLTGFTLVDVSDQSTVAALADGTEVDLGAGFAGSFGIRAEVAANARVGSVTLSLAGPVTVSRYEGTPPYSLYSDEDDGAGGRALRGAALPAGKYTLSATAYSKRSAKGAVLGTRTVSFDILSAPALSVADGPGAAVAAGRRCARE